MSSSLLFWQGARSMKELFGSRAHGERPPLQGCIHASWTLLIISRPCGSVKFERGGSRSNE
jgi:hypothetical protein